MQSISYLSILTSMFCSIIISNLSQELTFSWAKPWRSALTSSLVEDTASGCVKGWLLG